MCSITPRWCNSVQRADITRQSDRQVSAIVVPLGRYSLFASSQAAGWRALFEDTASENVRTTSAQSRNPSYPTRVLAHLCRHDSSCVPLSVVSCELYSSLKRGLTFLLNGSVMEVVRLRLITLSVSESSPAHCDRSSAALKTQK